MPKKFGNHCKRYLTGLIYTMVSQIKQNFLKFLRLACFEMVINDYIHMSNHPAIFWPVSAESGNSVKKDQKWQKMETGVKTKILFNKKCPK